MTRQLIVNADDFGRSPGVNRGVIETHTRGIVTSTSLMVNMPGADEAFALADEHPELGVGVHLVFTFGRPILPPEQVPSLVDDQGRFLAQRVVLAQPERLDLGELRVELAAQVAHFRAHGREPTHLDCHHFAHLHPRFFAAIVDLAVENDLPTRYPFADDLEAMARREAANIGLPAELPLDVGRRDIALLETAGLRHPDHFIGEFFAAGNIGVENLLRLLAGLKEGTTELMTHPGYVDDVLLDGSGYAWEREEELATLTDPRVREEIKRAGIQLMNYGSLRREV